VADKPLKTLLIIPSVNPAGGSQRLGLGGSERMTLNLCQYFDRSEIEPHLLVFHDPGQTLELLDQYRVPVYLLRKRGRIDPVLWGGLRRLIATERFDAVLSMLQGTNLHNLLVTPTVPGVACLISYRGGSVYPWLARSEGRLAYRAQRLITPASSVAAELEAKYRIAKDRIVQIPNGCDTARFPMQHGGTQERHRRDLGLPEDALLLYTPSRIDPAKGQDILAEALSTIQPLLRQYRVIWVNTGPVQDQELLARVEVLTAPFADHVRLLEATDDPAAWYAACDAVVLPSRIEAFSNVLLESAFSGRMFLASGVGETPDVVATIGGGKLFDGTAGDLADRLKLLFGLGRANLLNAGLQLVQPAREHYSLEQTAAQFAATIAAAVDDRRSAASRR
jgi:glycosyltransferase involved in cell wall biosynthesis